MLRRCRFAALLFVFGLPLFPVRGDGTTISPAFLEVAPRESVGIIACIHVIGFGDIVHGRAPLTNSAPDVIALEPDRSPGACGYVVTGINPGTAFLLRGGAVGVPGVVP